MAYAYDVYVSDVLSGMQLNAHEIGLRICPRIKKEVQNEEEAPTSENKIIQYWFFLLYYELNRKPWEHI